MNLQATGGDDSSVISGTRIGLRTIKISSLAAVELSDVTFLRDCDLYIFPQALLTNVIAASRHLRVRLSTEHKSNFGRFLVAQQSWVHKAATTKDALHERHEESKQDSRYDSNLWEDLL